MKEFKMRLNPAVAEEGKNKIEKSNFKGKIALLMITSSLIIAEGLVMANKNIRIISTKNGNEIMFYTESEIKHIKKVPGEPLLSHELKQTPSLKRILKK